MQSKPQRPTSRHHYLPEFYLKRWVNSAGKLTEYAHRGRVGVTGRQTSPGGTGWQKNLYKADGMPDEVANAFEEFFFAPVDNLAAETLRLLEQRGEDYPYTIAHRRSWSRFVVSLMTRMPEDLAAMKRHWRDTIFRIDPTFEAEYAVARTDSDPATLAAYVATMHPGILDGTLFRVMSDIIDGGKISEDVATIHWRILLAPEGSTGLLTSDRPLIVSAKFGGPEGHIAMPIAPRRLFIMARDPLYVDWMLTQTSVEELIRYVNGRVVEAAKRFVYSSDQRQTRFIQNRLGTKPLASPIEELIAKLAPAK